MGQVVKSRTGIVFLYFHQQNAKGAADRDDERTEKRGESNDFCREKFSFLSARERVD